jgi:hypothetical protein
MKKLAASTLLLLVCLLVTGVNAAAPPRGSTPAPTELSSCTDACQADYMDCRADCRYLPADQRFYCLDSCDVERAGCLTSCNP